MRKNFLGIGAGLALGAAVLSTSALASTTLVLDDASVDLAGDNTHVGDVDMFLGACEAGGGGIQVEIDCINAWQSDFSFSTADADKMDIDDLPYDPFLDVGTLQTVTVDGDLVDNVFVTESDIYAVKLIKQGGWFSVKTGNISCTSGTALKETDADGNVSNTTCDGTEKQFFLIFENLDLLLYSVFNLSSETGSGGLGELGFFLADITKISHITIVPLPAAALLFGSALFGGGLMRRRKMIKKHGLATA